MNKVIRDNKVAVLVSPGFGAGWYSWHHIPELLFDPVVVNMVENGEFSKIVPYCKKTYSETAYFSGVKDLEIVWVEAGEKFRIDEYDGSEALIRFYEDDWIVA